MEPHSFGNTDLTVSIIGLGCYGISGAYGAADDAECNPLLFAARWISESICSTRRPAMPKATIIA